MAEPITDRDREAVRRVHAAGRSRNAIARKLNRGAATVSKIAAEPGLSFSGGARSPPPPRRTGPTPPHGASSSPTRPSTEPSGGTKTAGAESARDARDHATAARALTEVHARVAELARQTGTGSSAGSILDRLADVLIGPTGGDITQSSSVVRLLQVHEQFSMQVAVSAQEVVIFVDVELFCGGHCFACGGVYLQVEEWFNCRRERLACPLRFWAKMNESDTRVMRVDGAGQRPRLEAAVRVENSPLDSDIDQLPHK